MSQTTFAQTDKPLTARQRAAAARRAAKRQAAIKARNAAFAKLTKAEQRVVVAKDVLAQIAAKRLIPEQGVWLDLPDDASDAVVGPYPDDFNEVVAYKARLRDAKVDDITRGRECTACAVGSLFLATVERANKCTVGQVAEGASTANFFGPSIVQGYLKKFFSERQLGLIESAFEGDSSFGPVTDAAYQDACARAADEYFGLDPEDSLVRIMRNIIKNKGTFVAPKAQG